jgi:phage gp29-like protein
MSEQAKPQLDREIATTADGIDITRGYTGPLLAPYDSVLRNRGGDLTLYEQVYSDPEVKSAFDQRQLAVVSCEWQVDAGGKRAIDKAAADFMREQIQKIGWDNITRKMLFGVFYGYAVAEQLYEVQGNRIGIKQVKVRNRRRFRFGKDMDLRLLTYDKMLEGIPAEAPYFWSFSTGADNDDEPYGLGLAHWLYWPVLFKRNGLKFWLIFLEKFGMPTGVGKYDSAASDGEKNKLLQAVRAIQTDSGIIMPAGMTIELLEAARSGTADYKALQDAMNATIAKVVLGQTASTSGTPGKLGNDNLQGDVRADIIKADADLVCESWNMGPARWLTAWNFPGAAVPRVFRVTDEPEDLTERADRDGKVKTLGYKPTLQYVTDTYGPGWEPVSETPPVDPNALPDAQFAEPGTVVQDPPAQMVDQLSDNVAPAAGAWLDQVRALAGEVESLEALREGLLQMLPDLSLEQYAAAMQEGLTAAALAGRYDVLQESGA